MSRSVVPIKTSGTVEMHRGIVGGEESGNGERAEQAEDRSDQGQLHAGDQDDVGDVPDAGAEGEANGKLAGALRHRAGDDAVDA